jgi:hypothetical protein
MLAVVLLLLVPAGCGASEGITSSPEPDSASSGQGSLKTIHWDIVRLAHRSVLIGAFVPYCEYTKPEPRIEKVKERRRPGRVTLTMLVRFPPRVQGCLGVEISVGRWVRLDRDTRGLRFFDGKTSAPEEVQERQ